MSINEKVDRVFAEVLSIDASTDKDTLIYNEIEGWDSVGHMAMVAGLEDAFDCMLDMDDILDMSSYSKVVEIMAKHV